MTGRLARITVAMFLWVALLAAGLLLLDIGRLKPVPGAVLIDAMQVCSDEACQVKETAELPYFSPRRFSTETEMRHFRFSLDLTAALSEPMALYLPKLSDNLDLRLNGQLVHRNSLPRRLWNTPVLIALAPALFEEGENRFDLTLHGTPSEGLDLQPVYFGPHSELAPLHAARLTLGPGLARFALGLMVMFFCANMLIWLNRPEEHGFLYLGLSCAAAWVFLVHFGYQIEPARHGAWAMLWNASIGAYVLFVLKFARSFLGLRAVFRETLFMGLLALWLIAVPLVPDAYGLAVALSADTLVFLFAVSVLVTIWSERRDIRKTDFWVLFLCLSLSVTLGLYGLMLFILPEPPRGTHLFHVMPLVMSTACLWLILSRLIASLWSYERLTTEQNRIIDERTGELEASFQRLAEADRRRAIAEERDRIMLDLHDGIGGQLVSTLAYMKSNHVGDDTLRIALEDALRDLALMLDSMENHDSLVTLLGMLRTRLEGLLSEHGIVFDWQVHGEPRLAKDGPSQSLQLARIVQEAITNVIKHANADTIVVFADETEIRISDNGTGFDPEAVNPRSAHGIANMKRRAAAIGLDMTITSDQSGTSLSLRVA